MDQPGTRDGGTNHATIAGRSVSFDSRCSLTRTEWLAQYNAALSRQRSGKTKSWAGGLLVGAGAVFMIAGVATLDSCTYDYYYDYYYESCNETASATLMLTALGSWAVGTPMLVIGIVQASRAAHELDGLNSQRPIDIQLGSRLLLTLGRRSGSVGYKIAW